MLIYISMVRPDIELIFRKIFRLNRIILLYISPLLIYSILTNVKFLFTDFGHVSVSVGLFPFSNTDTLSTIFAILLVNGIYDYFVLKKSNLLTLLLEFLLLLTAMNIKYIAIIIFSMAIYVVMKSKRFYVYVLEIMIIILISIFIIDPTISKSRVIEIPHSPVFIISGMIISGVVKEHSMIFGQVLKVL